MGRDAIVAGTGFSNPDGSSRSDIIRKHCKEGMSVQFKREPKNAHDPNAIAVLITVQRMFGLFGSSQAQIGYVKSEAAKSLAKKMDTGTRLSGFIKSFYAPAGIDHPRVSLRIEYDEA